jgi:hypothetical protein
MLPKSESSHKIPHRRIISGVVAIKSGCIQVRAFAVIDYLLVSDLIIIVGVGVHCEGIRSCAAIDG